MARKQKTIHYLYKTTCLVTGRYYIGMHSTNNLEDGYMGSGKRLRYSLRKHGINNHKKEILEFFESRELLIEAEKKAITEDMLTDTNCMNIMSGGTGGWVSKEASSKGGKISGLKHSERLKTDFEYLEKHNHRVTKFLKVLHGYKSFEGKKHSEETKQKMSESSKGMGVGETNSQYGTCWITKDGLSKKIKKEDLDSYLKEGWAKGRKF